MPLISIIIEYFENEVPSLMQKRRKQGFQILKYG
jgi:hypothetical protein